MSSILETFDLTHLDATMILITIPLFLLLWWALRTYLFAPFLSLIEARESATEGKQTQAAQLVLEIESVESKIADALREARVEGNLQRSQIIETARREADSIVQSAEEDAQEHVRNSRWQLLQEFDSVRQQALSEAAPLANDLIRRILPQGVQ